MPIKITDSNGFIVDKNVRKAYDRLVSNAIWSASSTQSAEAFLKLVERYAAKGIRLI